MFNLALDLDLNADRFFFLVVKLGIKRRGNVG